MKIVIGNDHAGVDMKWELIEYLKELGHEVVNLGTDDKEKAAYPEYGAKVGCEVAEGRADCGIAICGTGVGISIAANKVPGVRAAVCTDVTTARLAKQHNNANVLALGARVVGMETARDIVQTYLSAKFEGGRHLERINMISDLEKK